MEFFDVVRNRHSTRAFAPKPVEPKMIETILTAANLAPSAGNLQAYEIYLLTRMEHRIALAKAALEQWFVADAPVVLVFCANPARSARRYRERGVHLYSVQDATIACSFAMLAVTALGLASVWVGAFDDEAVRRVLGVSKELVPVAILPVGCAVEQPEATGRRRLTDLVHRL